MTSIRLTRISRSLRKRDAWAEKLLWSWLRDRRFSAYKFRRQHAYGPYVLDFFCVEAMVNIELDGFQHGTPGHRERDGQRDSWLQMRGVKVLRFWNGRLRREKRAIRDAIWDVLQSRAPTPVPGYCRPLQSDSRVNGLAAPPSPSP